MIKKILIIFLMSGAAFATQNVHLKNTGTASVLVSNKDINMLSIKGDRIASLALPKTVEVEQDTKSGAAFLKFNSKQNIKGYIQLESGKQFSVEFVVSDVQGDNIVLIKPDVASSKPLNMGRDYTKALARLLRGMFNQEAVEGFDMSVVGKKTKLFNKNVEHLLIFTGEQVQGDVYLYKNKTKRIVDLRETDFFTPGVRAVSLSNSTVKPNTSVHIFIMRDL